MDWAEQFGFSDEVPFFERFFLGGSSTVRGHRTDMIGPKDKLGQPIGGELRMYLNPEIRFPLYKEILGSVFLDSGGVWTRPDKFGFHNWGNGAGYGLRYKLKWWKIEAIARLDFAVNLDVKEKEGRARIHATIGMPF